LHVHEGHVPVPGALDDADAAAGQTGIDAENPHGPHPLTDPRAGGGPPRAPGQATSPRTPRSTAASAPAQATASASRRADDDGTRRATRLASGTTATTVAARAAITQIGGISSTRTAPPPSLTTTDSR